MAFVPIGKQKYFRAADLYGSPLVGRYLKKTDGKYSPIYWFKNQSDEEIGLYGSRSLNDKLTDDLLGELLQIRCVKLIEIGKAYPLAIVEVCVWRDDGKELINPAFDMSDPSIPKLQDFASDQHPSSNDDDEVPAYALTIPDEA